MCLYNYGAKQTIRKGALEKDALWQQKELPVLAPNKIM